MQLMKIDLYSFFTLVSRRCVSVAVLPVPGAPEMYIEPGLPATRCWSSHDVMVSTWPWRHSSWLGVPVCRAALAAWNWLISAVNTAGLAAAAGLAGDCFLAGENKAVLFKGDPSLEGVAGFLGDFVGNFGTGDFTGEHRRSSNCCEVTRLGDLVGNNDLVGVGFSDCLESFTGVLVAGFVGDANKLAAALLVLTGADVLAAGLGEHRRSSS